MGTSPLLVPSRRLLQGGDARNLSEANPLSQLLFLLALRGAVLVRSSGAKSNMQCPDLAYRLQRKIMERVFCLWIVQESGTRFLKRAYLCMEAENKWGHSVVGSFGMDLRWPHWAVKPIKSLYYKIMCSEHAMYLQKNYSRNVVRDFYMFIWYLFFVSLAPRARCFNHNKINCPGHREIGLGNNVVPEALKNRLK